MTSINRFVGRTVALHLVGVLILLPISASASPVQNDVNSISANAHDNGKGGEGNGGENNGNAGEGNNGNGPPSITPSGVVPTQGGLGSVDAQLLPSHLGAAIVIFYQQDEEEAPAPVPAAVVAPPTTNRPVSTSVVRVLTPVLPPVLANGVAAPIMLLEALIEAMAASGQAVVIPLIASGAAFLLPGLRRKSLLDAISAESTD